MTTGPTHGNATTRPHELRFADGEDIGGLNPMFFQQIVTNYLAEMTMAYLFRYDHDNKPVPELSTEVPTQRNGDIDAAGTTIRIKLRHGVVWSDGAPFTADDVVFSTNAMNDPRNPVTSRQGFELVTKIDEPDKYTVVFHLKRPFAAFLPIFFTTGGAEPCIQPKHLLANIADLSQAPYNALPVGIGPFKYAAWHRGSNVELVPNPHYWRGLPKLKRVTFEIINDDNTMYGLAQTGALDLWMRTHGNFVERARGIHGYHIVSGPSYQYGHFDFNVTRPAVADVAVRRALRLGLDRATMLQKVGHGLGTLQESVVPPTYPEAPKAIPKIPFDIAKANAKLDAAGWVRGANGIRAKNGTQLALTIVLVAGSPLADALIELARNSWQQLGVSISVKRYLASQLFDPLTGILRKGDFDIAMFNWVTEAVDDPTTIFSCEGIPPAGQNYGRFCDRSIEPAMANFRKTYDAKEQGAALGEFERGLVPAVPTIVIYYVDNIFLENGDLTGFRPNQVSTFDDMMNVDI